MRIKLTKKQIELVKIQLAETIKAGKNKSQSGWDLVALSNDIFILEDVVKKGYTDI